MARLYIYIYAKYIYIYIYKKKNKIKRLLCAKAHKDWTIEQWNKTL